MAYENRRDRKPSKPQPTAMESTAKKVADILWSKAMKIVDQLAPEHPADSAQMEEFDQFAVFEIVLPQMSPEFWNDPDAVMAYHRLLGKYAPTRPRDWLLPIAKAQRVNQRSLPDPTLTPEDPEYEKMVRRITRRS